MTKVTHAKKVDLLLGCNLIKGFPSHSLTLNSQGQSELCDIQNNTSVLRSKDKLSTDIMSH